VEYAAEHVVLADGSAPSPAPAPSPAGLEGVWGAHRGGVAVSE
jgi:hypothetical protein